MYNYDAKKWIGASGFNGFATYLEAELPQGYEIALIAGLGILWRLCSTVY